MGGDHHCSQLWGQQNLQSCSKAPGSLGMNGSAGAIYPEDYNESGSMWDHLERNNIDFYNFGFSIMFEPAFYTNRINIRHQTIRKFPCSDTDLYKDFEAISDL
jgi:hypothetical protein